MREEDESAREYFGEHQPHPRRRGNRDAQALAGDDRHQEAHERGLANTDAAGSEECDKSRDEGDGVHSRQHGPTRGTG